MLLPFVLSMIAGSADVIGFLGLGGLLTAHITGNLVLLAVLGPAVIRALDRFRRRFLLDWVKPESAPEPAPAKISADVGTPA